jgi:Phage integrase, N-terminal SAM-like domain
MIVQHLFLPNNMDDLFLGKAATKAANAPVEKLRPNPKGRLREQFHEVARFQHLSLRTEGTYWDWVVRYLKFHRDKSGGWRRPRKIRP